MSVSEDLINFDIIETQKENIQSLPGGRSAKALASRFSPNLLHSPTPSDTKNLNDAIRQEYEIELQSSADSDDPLDVYDRYVKWTLSAYPSAQATPESQLRPLLERATKAFQSASHYKSDPRYLKFWLNYIRFFSDSPRETFAYLSRHNIGESLALFYEEFAAWLEGAGRWHQADEVYKLGIEREARPTERLLRKFAEFQKRLESHTQNPDEPSSPALPTVRPALVAKMDPFAGSGSRPTDPQAPRPQPGIGGSQTSSRSGRQKISIFSDGDAPAPSSSFTAGESARGWDNIGSIAERKKENMIEPRPWSGETMKGGKKAVAAPKMTIFRDESHLEHVAINGNESTSHADQQVTNPRTGKIERVFANLQSIYPTSNGVELSFEELRADARGWLNTDWSAQAKPASQEIFKSSPITASESTTTIDLGHTVALDFGRAPKAGRPKKMKTKEIRGETQTIKINLSSPTGPKIRRKTSAEPTMTLHTKAATDDVLDMFNQSLRNVDPLAPTPESDGDSDFDDDDYTSAGESTSTGRISRTSEFGDTQPDIRTEPLSSEGGNASVSPWSEFTTSKHVPKLDGQDADENDDNTGCTDQSYGDTSERNDTQRTGGDEQTTGNVDSYDALTSPINNADDEQWTLITPVLPDQDEENQAPQTRYVPVPPEEYEPPVRAMRDPGMLAQSRLPFMTPIVEKTESSLGAFTAKSEKDYFNSKTPSRKAGSQATPDFNEENLSGPLRELVNEARPDRPPKLDISSKSQTAKAKSERGPIIKDAQCNPIDETIRANILAVLSPPLSSFPGFHDYRPATCSKLPDVRKYIKSLAKSRPESKTTTSTGVPPTIKFEAGVSASYTVKREIGKGAFAPVYLAQEQKSDDVDEKALVAMKCEDTPTPWEFYIMTTLHSRLAASPDISTSIHQPGCHPSILPSLCKPRALHLFADEAYLLEDYLDQGTLLDLVNVSKSDPSSNGSMDESIAMYFTIELLRTVEAMHAAGILHGDLKADNCLVRLKSPPSSSSFNPASSTASLKDEAVTDEEEWSPHYSSSGSDGWSARGITLIDFGRSIDLRHSRPDVRFIADWKTGKQDCPEMRQMRPWTYQVDYWGVAGVVHNMLWGKYMDDNVVSVPVEHATNTAATSAPSSTAHDTAESSVVAEQPTSNPLSAKLKPREPFKRYWQVALWTRLFDILLNPVLCASRLVSEGGEPNGGQMPCTLGLKAVRRDMEAWLEEGEGGRRKGGLRAGLRKLGGDVVKGRRGC